MTVPNLSVRTAVNGLVTPIGIAFVSSSQWLVIEKNTGRVRRALGPQWFGDLFVVHRPTGTLLLVALDKGTVYEVFRSNQPGNVRSRR